MQQNQGVGQTPLPLEALGGEAVPASSGLGWLPAFLGFACGCITSLCLSGSQSLLLCVREIALSFESMLVM